MYCPQCQTEVANGAAFCSNCGLQLKLACPVCGADHQLSAKFCAQCGARLYIENNTSQRTSNTAITQTAQIRSPLPIQSEGYERRMVTILFADLASYSTLSESLDPEALLEIMRKAYPCFLEPIQNYGGTVVQVMGDGVLAYFGTPIAQEDDPERAVTAGLEIITRIQKYAAQLQSEKGLDHFKVRIGINTGLVVVGDLSPEKHLEYLALGDAVNLAARLQQLAPPDGLLISHETFRLIQGIFDVIPQKPITVKGRQQITQTYLVKQVRPLQQRRSTRGIIGVETPMVGREPELASLQNHYQDAIIGHETALILIYGDPGIGKTRLANTLLDWAALQDVAPTILRGRAIPSTQPVPFGVLRNLFAKIFNILETDSNTEALEKFREGTQKVLSDEEADLVGQYIGFNFKISPAVQRLLGDPDFAKIAHLFLVNYFRKLAESPLLILFEDLHWLDDSTLDLIIEIVEKFSQEGNSHLLIACTTRPEFFERRAIWGEGIPGFSQIKLRRLSRLRSRTLIQEILREVDVVPEVLFKCITDVAEGNPFFIEELIKMLMDQGVIQTAEDEWHINLQMLPDIHVPPTLIGILQARMDSLPPAEKLVLQRAAVIGRTFWNGLIKALTNVEREAEHVDDYLSALRERGLIYQLERSTIEGHQEYLFKHALVRDAAYETVLLKHRQIYHSQVAAWIEVNAGDRLEEHFALIASHYADGGQPNLAGNWALHAGERAASQYSMNEAKDLFEKALSMIRPDNLESRWRGTLGHSEALGVLGHNEDRHIDDKALLDLAHQMGDESRIAEAHYMIGSQAYREGNNAVARQAFNEALQAARAAGDILIQAEILPMQVVILSAEGEFQSAAGIVEHALSIAQQAHNPNVLARALTNLAMYYLAIGDACRSVDLMHQQIQINQQQGNRLGEAIGLTNLGYYYLSLGQFETGHNQLERALQLARRLEARRITAYCLLNLGLAEWRLGKPEEACHTIAQSLARLEALRDQMGLASRQLYLGLANEGADALSKAAAAYQAARDAFDTLGVKPQMMEAQAGLARIALKCHDLQGAKNTALQVIDYIDQEGAHGFELPILAFVTCARVFEATGDNDQLTQTIERGRKELNNLIDKINDASWREIFLEAVPENRVLLAYDPIGHQSLV
jgi:class 3 adenylate cyclase/tetratricopeptide (TPR) repeat protein